MSNEKKSDWTLYVKLYPQPTEVDHISDKAIRLKTQCVDVVLPKSQVIISTEGDLMVPMWLLRDLETSPCISVASKFWLNKSTGEITPKKNGNSKK